MDRKYVEAVELLNSFTHDQPVLVTVKPSKQMKMWISRTAHRSDGAFGSYESTGVTVTYGVGRYATRICADKLVQGLATIEPREESGENDPQKGALVVEEGGDTFYEVISINPSKTLCHIWHYGPILTVEKLYDGHWYFNGKRVRFTAVGK